MTRKLVPKFDCSPVFHKLHNTTKRIVVSRGSSSSTKTFSKCQMLANWLWCGKIRNQYIPDGVATVGRQFSTSLVKSVIRDFLNVLNTTPMHWSDTGEFYCYMIDVFDHNKSERTFTRGHRVVEFIGLDDYHKAKGPRRKILWINEADEVKYKIFVQLEIRTKNIILLDFNPDDEDIWINQELEIKRASIKGDVEVLVSTYKENPYLQKEEVDAIEYMKHDPELWVPFGMGEYGKIKGRIFDFKTIASVPKNAEFLGYGLDFGFKNDPTSIVGLYRYNGELIFDEICYSTGLFNTDIDKILKQNNVSRRDDIVCDSAEPKSIAELYNMNYNAYAVEKGKDSINFGISVMKQYNINITARSSNLIKEMKKYKWAEDKNGRSLNKPVDRNDHAIDAARYVAMTKLPKKSRRGGKFLIGSV